MDDYLKSSAVERKYRSLAAADLLKYRIVIGESDLWVMSSIDLKEAVKAKLKFYRRVLKEYIHQYPLFKDTLIPFSCAAEAPELIKRMCKATERVGVGPMAAVAGAIAAKIGEDLASNCPDLIIENGGDIYLRSSKQRIIAVYAGDSRFSNRIGVIIPTSNSGCGICTSAGAFGPSLSFGNADAVMILAADAALADAAATATGNLIHDDNDFRKAVDFVKKIPELTGVLIIKDEKMTAWGELELTPLN